MRRKKKYGRVIRLLAIGLIIGLGAYWAGSRYGTSDNPVSVAALRLAASRSKAAGWTPPKRKTSASIKQAAPAVANVTTRTMEYDFFFNPVPVEGAGSGFLIDTAGTSADEFSRGAGRAGDRSHVRGADQTRYKAKMIGADSRNDIALIQIDLAGHKLTPLTLGDSKNLMVGQRVLAIGNPFGFQSTLTTGVVSSLGRTVQTGDNTFIDEAIQTDASINRGNSGGPLLNSHGEVIGINSAIYSPTETSAGIGFAIPVNTARRVAEDLIANGRVRRATLGAEGTPLWPELAKRAEFAGAARNSDRASDARRRGGRGGNSRRQSLGDRRDAAVAHWRRRDRRDQRKSRDGSDGFESSAESRSSPATPRR